MEAMDKAGRHFSILLQEDWAGLFSQPPSWAEGGQRVQTRWSLHCLLVRGVCGGFCGFLIFIYLRLTHLLPEVTLDRFPKTAQIHSQEKTVDYKQKKMYVKKKTQTEEK